MLEVFTKIVFALLIGALITTVAVFSYQIAKGKKQRDKSQVEAAKLGLQMSIPVICMLIAIFVLVVTL